MSKEKRLNRNKESLFSLLSLAAIVVLIAVVLLVQSSYELESFGVGDATAGASPMAVKSIFVVSDNFEVFSPPEQYPEDNLYEKINGKAPLYTDAGFEMLDTQRYTFNPASDNWMEIYRYEMSTPRAAYNVYSTQKRAGSDSVSGIGAEYAYQTSSGIFLAIGEMYYEIMASAEDDDMLQAIIESLPDIAKLDDYEYMPLPDFMPDKWAVDGTFKLYMGSAFGVAGLGDVYVRNYMVDDNELMAFVIDKKYGDVYKNFLVNNGAQKLEQRNGIEIYDFFGVYELITTKGGKFAAVRDAYDKEAAYKLLDMISQTLQE